MLKQIEIEQIKKLIKSGFDLELISFELDIPIEQLVKYKEEFEHSKNTSRITNKEASKQIDSYKNNKSYYKMRTMRENYNALYSRTVKSQGVELKPLSEEEIKLIESVIASIKSIIQKMQTLSRKEKRKLAYSILSELKKIEQYELPILQLEQLYMLIYSKELSELAQNKSDKISYFIDRQKAKITYKFGRAIELEQYGVDDIDRLEELYKKLTVATVKERDSLTGTVKSKISSKLIAIRQQQALDKIKNNISENIVEVINGLLVGNIDIKRANAIIDEEAKKRAKSKSSSTRLFGLTEEQERRQILIQIRTAIIERTDIYQVQEPERTILLMQELLGGELQQSIMAVVKNLVAQKEFDKAKSICDRFSERRNGDELESQYSKYIRTLKREIRNAEISHIVLKAVKMVGTPEEDANCFELIEKGMKSGNIKLSEISLGKSRDRVRNITLADIWPEKVKGEYMRERNI